MVPANKVSYYLNLLSYGFKNYVWTHTQMNLYFSDDYVKLNYWKIANKYQFRKIHWKDDHIISNKAKNDQSRRIEDSSSPLCEDDLPIETNTCDDCVTTRQKITRVEESNIALLLYVKTIYLLSLTRVTTADESTKMLIN